MIPEPTPEWAIELTKTLREAYPEMDAERGVMVRNLLRQHREGHARTGVREYIEKGGDELFKLGRLMAIIDRLRQQDAEKEAFAANQAQLQAEMEERERVKKITAAAESRIGTMSDEDVRALWLPILNAMTGKPREWAEKWPISQVRGNRQLVLKVAESLHDEEIIAELIS